MTDFQSEFVFGLQGKHYQNFVDNIARPIIREIIGTDDYEFINFEHHLSHQDFANTKNSIVSHIYNQFLKDIKRDKETGEVSFKKKVCISLDDRLCTEICPNTGRKITAIKLANIELAYFIYFDIKEFFNFVYSNIAYNPIEERQLITSKGVIDNHNFERGDRNLTFVLISQNEGIPIYHSQFQNIINFPIGSIIEITYFVKDKRKIVDKISLSEDKEIKGLCEFFEGHLYRRQNSQVATIEHGDGKIFVPSRLVLNVFEENKYYHVMCLAIKKSIEEENKLEWEAMEIFIIDEFPYKS